MRKLIALLTLIAFLAIQPAVAQFILSPGQNVSKTFSSTNDSAIVGADGCQEITYTIVPSAVASSSGTWNGVVTFQGTLDGTNYVNVQARNVKTGALGATATTTAAAIYTVPNYGYNKIKAYPSTLTTGSAVVTGRCGKLTHPVDVNPTSTGLGTATVTPVAISASSVTLLAANENRRGATIVNNTGESLYIKYGSTAVISTSGGSFTHLLTTGSSVSLPSPVYTGIITGIWAATTSGGYALVTETNN